MRQADDAGPASRGMDKKVFWPSAILTLVFVAWGVAMPGQMERAVNVIFGWTTGNWGWLYLLTAFLLVLACIYLLFSPLGRLKLGRPEDEPEFSDASWFAMLFGSAIAAGIVFWGPAEPAYHYMTPSPFFEVKGLTPQAASAAMTTSFFHWGLSAWAIYALMTIPLAHACYTKGLPFRFSSAFYYLLGDKVRGAAGRILDIFAVFATLGGLATTTGLVGMQLSSGFKYYYGLEMGGGGTMLIVGILTAIFTFAVYTGLEKGIKLLGDLNLYLFIGMWFFVLALGPTIYLISLTTESLGAYLGKFLEMSLYLATGREEAKWLGSWTIFYWAWWFSWSPFVAIFIARISKGRTVRETIAATLILPTIANFLWYGVVGGAGISFDVTGALKEHGVESAIFAIAQNLPLTPILVIAIIVLIATFFLTSANSAALALAMFVTGQETPGRNMRAFWGVSLGAVAIVLLSTGSIKAIQTASIATAFPLMFLLLMAIASALKGLSAAAGEKGEGRLI
jgi:glycine betaine transporter